MNIIAHGDTRKVKLSKRERDAMQRTAQVLDTLAALGDKHAADALLSLRAVHKGIEEAEK